MDTLSLANLVLDLASVINFIALLLMLRAVVKNRKVLRGYSIVGSFLTFVSILGFEVAYYLLGNTLVSRWGGLQLLSGSSLLSIASGND